ncbi:MAG: hypothetical protein S4CHLAM102_15630 [Chlamydiia bacterium]|nr:hypothetical protein [Chlamydiia bacterium]
MCFLLYLSAVAVFIMTGLAWYGQITVFPSWEAVRSENKKYFPDFERRAPWVMIPFMLFDITFAFIILFGMFELKSLIWISGMLLIFIWLETFGHMLKMFMKLAVKPTKPLIDSILASNAFRTALWTARAVLITVCLYYNM